MPAAVIPLGSNISPNKHTEEPDMPDGPQEVAHQLTSKDTSKLCLSSDDAEMAATGSEGAGPSSAPDSPSCSTAETDPASDLGCVPLNSLVTEKMLNIEKELHRQSVEEEKRLKEESISAWQKEQDEQRYKRLQHLLEKSSIYSNFLLNKMEEQQKQEKMRQEKRAKKLKKKQEEEERKRQEAEGKLVGKDAEKENKESKEAGPATRRNSRYGKQASNSQEVAGASESQEQDRDLSADSQNSYPQKDQASSGKASPIHFSQADRWNTSKQDSKSPIASSKSPSQGLKSKTDLPQIDPVKESPSLRKDEVELERTYRPRRSSRIAKTGKGEKSTTGIVNKEDSLTETVNRERRMAKTVKGEPRIARTVWESRRVKTNVAEGRSAETVKGNHRMAKTVRREHRMAKTVTDETRVAETVTETRRTKSIKAEDRLAETVEGECRMGDGYTMPHTTEAESAGSDLPDAQSPDSVSSRSPTGTSRSRGRKRVREDYSIADYIDKSTLTSKKPKPEATETGSSGTEDKASCPPTLKTKNTQEDQTDTSQDGGSANEDNKPEISATKLTEEFVDSYSRTINGEKISDLQPDLLTGGCLRKYQVEGIEWLKVLYENGVNGILGDEMGLGKTIQCIGLFAHIIKMGVPGPFLVVAPLSTLSNWMSEFKRFTPSLIRNLLTAEAEEPMDTETCESSDEEPECSFWTEGQTVSAPSLIKVILYHGTPEERERLRRQLHKPFGEYKTLPVVVTSYEIVMIDRKHLCKHLWKYIIVDEGHRIKNLNCRLIRELKMYHSANRVLLTGTPLQNNLSELWSMLNFLLPEVFDDLNTFESWFDFSTLTKEGGDEAIVAKEREQHVVSMLHQILSPFLLRRLKSDVELNVPPKKEILVQAPLTAKQAELYRGLVDKTILNKMEEKYIRAEDRPKTEEPEPEAGARVRRRCRVEVDYALMGDMGGKEEGKDKEDSDIEAWIQKVTEQAERCQQANKKGPKPQIKDAELNIKIKHIVMQLRKACNHPYLLEYPLDPVTQEYRIDEDLVTNSGKLMVLERLLPALKKQNHKVLIFSQMTHMLDVLEDYCYLRKYRYCRLDGTMKLADRQEQIDEFNKDQDMFLFLLSTRAGGLGINLTAADTVIIYDSDWNPQSDLQAQDRCHRIGQTKPVIIYRLVTSNTIDQKVVERAAAKRRLEKMVIHQGKFKGGKSNLAKDSSSLINPAELLELLRSTDHSGFVRNCNQNVISDADLKLLLDRSDLLARFNGQEKGTASATKAGPGKKGGKRKPMSKVFQVLEDGSEEDGTDLRIGT